MADISIIIPVFNKGDALCDCLDSILAQTFSEFECLLIDDGSTDGSGLICDQYAATDPRVKVVHKKNGGVSSARNVGIDMAQGRYLMFCDADDIIPQDALEQMICAMRTSTSELVVGGFDQVSIDRKNNTLQNTREYHRSFLQIDTQDTAALWGFWSDNNMLSSCGKLFQKEIISGNGILFDTGLVVMEDYAFVLDYLEHCTQICMIPNVVYRYITYTDLTPAQKRSRRDFLFDVLAVGVKLSKYLSGRTMDDSEMFHKKTIYPTLRYAYDILWSMEAPDKQSKKAKYARIGQAIKDDTFQKMLQYSKNSFNKAEYFCLRRKSIWCLLLLHAVQRLLPRKKRQ